MSDIDIVVDGCCSSPTPNVSTIGSFDEDSDLAGSMTFFTLSKTFQWVSRAKVSTWFRLAYRIPGSEEIASSRESLVSNVKLTPRLSNESRTKSSRSLTLEPEYRSLFKRDDSVSESDFNTKTVPKMMRSSSGGFSEEFMAKLHDKMLSESAKQLSENNN